MRALFYVPIAAFLVFVGFAAYQLNQPKSDFVPSTMIGQPLPAFKLEPMLATLPGTSDADFRDGKPKLLNFWASWCIPCIAEAPQLEQLHRAGIPIIGVVNRDTPEAVTQFLEKNGNPYQALGKDDLSEVMLAIGAQGLPETFVIDGKGKIIYQHIGDIRPEHVPMLLEKLKDAE